MTHAFLVPAVLQFMCMLPDITSTDFSALEMIAYGASPISGRCSSDSLRVFGCGFIQLYGLTETTGAVTGLFPEDHDPSGPKAHLLRSAGKPLDGVEIRIVDAATGVDAGVGEVGEIWVRTVQNMKGYWNLDDETAKTILDDGWLRSGDAGYLDADGYVYIHDRVKDMIVSGGENIYPAEIENVLMAHPAVADAAVIGVPSDRWGETPKAMIVRAAGADPTEQEIIDYCRERLAKFKCPTSVDWVDALPRNPSGKILKKDLRGPYWAGPRPLRLVTLPRPRRRSRTTYARMSDGREEHEAQQEEEDEAVALPPATRAGQKAIAIQMISPMMPPIHQPMRCPSVPTRVPRGAIMGVRRSCAIRTRVRRQRATTVRRRPKGCGRPGAMCAAAGRACR